MPARERAGTLSPAPHSLSVARAGPRRLILAARLAPLAVYYALYLVPVVVAVWFEPSHAYWLASAVASATVVVWLHGRGVRAAALAINLASTIANMLLMISLVIQGAGFNEQFFYHMDWETVVLGWRVFGVWSLGVGAYLLLLGLWPRLLPGPGDGLRARLRHSTVAVLIAVAVLLNASVLSMGWYLLEAAIRVNRIVLVPKPHRQAAPAGVDAPRNLVVIVAESLEATYGRPDLAGEDLTPSLTDLAKEGTDFADVRQVSHTGWTMGGLIAGSCATPISPKNFWGTVTRRAAPMPGAVCLGDVLAAEGYRTMFMGGAALWFGGKGSFLAAHGFGERLGVRALRPRLPDPTMVSTWGLYDDSLFALARGRIAQLAADKRPFALMLLTMDTHFPQAHASPYCGSRDDDDRKYVIRCADRMIAEFVAHVRATLPDAVVVLFTDHLSQESPERAGLVSTSDRSAGQRSPFSRFGFQAGSDYGARRLRFTVWDRERPPAVIDTPGTHFDVMPTVLDVLGFEGWRQHEFGASLFRFESPWWRHGDPDSLQVVYELPDLSVPHGTEVTFHTEGPTIETGGVLLLASGRGLVLDDAVFALRLHRGGGVSEILDTAAFEAATAVADAPLLIGVSSNRAVNRGLVKRGPGLVYFAGKFGSDRFVAGELPASGGARTILFDASPGTPSGAPR